MSLLFFAASAAAEVQVRLDQTSVTQNQPFRVTIEASGGSGGQPDLSPLNRDFQILGRSYSSRSSTINGRYTQQTTVTLTLAALRSGELEIPPIRIGNEQSQPVRLSVAAAPASGGTSGSGGQDPGSHDPFASILPASPSQQPYPASPGGFNPNWWGSPGWGAMPGGSPWEAAAPAAQPTVPQWGSSVDGRGWTPPQEALPPLTLPPAAPAAPLRASDGAGFWPWLTGLALLGWIGTALAWWHSRRPERLPPPVVIPARAKPRKEPKRPEELIAKVRVAYAHADAFEARDALLQWAAARWPEDPPANLSRLAVRCPPRLQPEILKLDEALYSPTPVRWFDRPVWSELEALSATGAAKPPPESDLAPT